MNEAPWEDIGWTEKQYLQWLRSSTRRIWNRHPLKTEYIKQNRKKAPLGKDGKMVWACECEMCRELKKSAQIEVDHIVAGGSFSTWQEYTEWAKRILWVGFSDLRLLCKECHALVTLSQKLGCTLDEAITEKIRIEFFKKKVGKQKEILKEWGAEEEEVTNKNKREEAFYKYWKE